MIAKKSAKRLILDLQEVGITKEYCNIILRAVFEEKENSYTVGQNVGQEEARAAFFKKCQESENFNTQYLKGWVKKLEF